MRGVRGEHRRRHARHDPVGPPAVGAPASARAELFRALGSLCEPPGPEHRRLGGLLGLPGAPDPADHTGLFLLGLPPHASVYLGPEGMLGGEAGDRVAGFWRAAGRVPPPEPDHLAALLGLYASLSEGEADRPEHDADARRLLRERARVALLWEHLLPWLGPYLAKVEEVASPFYGAWAGLLRESLLEEAAAAGLTGPASGEFRPASTGAAPPFAPELPVHLRAAPPVEDPRRGGREGDGGAFVAHLLAPVRSGMILVRADLVRAGRKTGMGVRMGERAYALRRLFAQDPHATLAWLAGEAREWAERHARAWRRRCHDPDPLAGIDGWWVERARATASLLETLAAGAPEDGSGS